MQAGNVPGGGPACASCKHQRKRCTPECGLAPYFPASRAAQFKAVHAVFGVSNISKMIKKVTGGLQDRLMAVESLVWEAEWRQRDAVLGPYREYRRLVHENQLLRRELALCRCRGVPGLNLNSIIIQNNNNVHLMAPAHDSVNYVNQNGNLIAESNHQTPFYFRGGIAQIGNGHQPSSNAVEYGE